MKNLITTNMNKVLIYIFTALFIVSCEDTDKCADRIEEHSVSENIEELDSSSCAAWTTHYKTYSLEGCEYIVVGFGHNRWGTHKGNCSNPIHKGQHPSPHQLDIVEMDSDQRDYSLSEKEKHFDCYVTEIIPEPSAIEMVAEMLTLRRVLRVACQTEMFSRSRSPRPARFIKLSKPK